MVLGAVVNAKNSRVNFSTVQHFFKFVIVGNIPVVKDQFYR